MSKIDTGGPAYPSDEPRLVLPGQLKELLKHPDIAQIKIENLGMTWLDKCAIEAMAQMIDDYVRGALRRNEFTASRLIETDLFPEEEWIARKAYKYASAMLAEKRRLEAGQ